jgi:hypothetical protein
VVDFVGNSTRHQLVYAADILGGVESKAAERVIEKQKEDEDSTPIDVLDELQRAEEELQKEKEEQLAVEKRSVVTAKVKYKSADLDPFDVLQINAPRTVWTGAPPLSTNQRAMLTRNGISVSDVDHHTQRVLFKELVRRRKNNLCTYKQAKLMRKYGYTGNESFERASEIIDNLAANNWKKS